MDLQEIAELLNTKKIKSATSMQTIGSEILTIIFEDETELMIYPRLEQRLNENGKIHYDPVIIGE